MSLARGIFAYPISQALTKRRIYGGCLHCGCSRTLASTASPSTAANATADTERRQQQHRTPTPSSPNAHSFNTNYPPPPLQPHHSPPNGATATSTTADHTEIEQFEQVDPSDWLDERNGAFRALHTFNRVRVPWILAHLGGQNLAPDQSASPLSGKRILDIGCGAGILSMSLVRLGAEVTGIDATQNAIQIAQRASKTLPRGSQDKIQFSLATVEEFAARDSANIGAFDAIVASEVVEHVTNLPSFIHACCRLAKANSPLFFTTINRTIFSRILAKVVAEDILRILPKGLHDYDKFVRPEELRKLLVDEQCRCGPVLGLAYNPLLNQWSWSRFTEVNYAMVAFTSGKMQRQQ